MENTMIKVGLIGFGRMGRFYLHEFQRNKNWQVTYICDPFDKAQEMARDYCPTAKVTGNEDDVFNDPEVEVVALCALADSRKDQILKALAHGKHIISEKPIAMRPEDEWELVKTVDQSDRLATVNLYLRSSWYHHQLKEFIDEGELGELAIIRICHMTPGLAPGEGHEAEGPSFHDCGMHYCDITRWYAQSEYKTMHSQALRMWNYKDPWWLQAHGTFENGIVYDITQGFVYGQMSKDQTHNSYIDLIGTHGIARMTHDFKTATVELRGITKTVTINKPYGGKNIDVMIEKFAQSIRNGKLDMTLPSLRDSAVASQFAWDCLADARTHDLPAIGDLDTLEQIRYRRAHMTNGYGLLHQTVSK